MDIEKKVADVTSSLFTDGWVENQVQEAIKSAIKRAIEDQFSWSGAGYKKIKEIVDASCEKSIGMVRAEDYFPKIEIFLKEIIDQTVEAEKKKLLGNFREFMIHDDIPEPEKGGYKRYIGLEQVFKKYCKFVAREFDTDGREIDYDDYPTYVPVECRAYIEEAERPKYYISDMEHATLFLVTEDGEDEHGESCNFAIPLKRWKDHDREGWWIARDAVSIDITDLRHANSMMCYLSKLRANDVLIMDTGECHNDCVELENKPEADWN